MRYLITDLLAHHEGTDLADDAIAVCLDWHAPASVPGPSYSRAFGGLPCKCRMTSP